MASAAEMSTKKGTRRCCATGTMAAVLPESKEPMSIWAPWVMTRSASVRPTSGLVCVSPRISSSRAPPRDLMPPAALTASAAICAPRRQAWPGSASGPVTGWTTPILKAGACARSTAGKPTTALAPAAAPAVLRKALRSVRLLISSPFVCRCATALTSQVHGQHGSAMLRMIVVKPAAALAAEAARHDHALEEGRRGVARLAELLEHHLGHEHGGVETDQVQEREGAHGIAAAKLHGLIDVLQRGEPALVDADGVQQIGHEEPVDDEGGRVLGEDGHLPYGLHPLVGALHGGVVGEDGAHHLDQLHQRHGIEEVQAEHLLWPLGGGGHGGDVAGGGVGSEERVRRADAVELAEGLVLHRLILGDGLDDEVAALEILQMRRAAEPAHRLVLGPRLDLRLGHQALEALLDPAQALVEEGLVCFDHDGGEARLRRHLGDAGAHEPATDHTDLLDGHARATSLDDLPMVTRRDGGATRGRGHASEASTRLLVSDQGLDAVTLQALPPLQEGQLDEEVAGNHNPSEPLDQAERGSHRAAGREQVVHDEHALALADGVLVDGEHVAPVLELVLLLDHRARELALLPHGHEARAQLLRQRAAEDEAARLHADHDIDLGRAIALGQMIDHRAPRHPILEQRGDVLEEDPFGREILDIADLCYEGVDVHDRGWMLPAGLYRRNIKSPCPLSRGAAPPGDGGPSRADRREAPAAARP